MSETHSKPFIKPNYELRRGTSAERKVHSKPSDAIQKKLSQSNTNKSDELIKHMSNLPDYLQQEEKGEDLQRNALNFGVLNWESLEKWKYSKNCVHAKGHRKTSSSLSSSSSMPRGIDTIASTSGSKYLNPQKKQPESTSCHSNTMYDRRSQENLLPLRRFEAPQKSTLNKQKNDIMLDKGKRKESYRRTASEKVSSLSDWRNPRTPFLSHDRMNSMDDQNMKMNDEVLQNVPGEQQCSCLLLSNQLQIKNCSSSSQLSGSTRSFDSILTEEHLKKFCHSGDLHSEIPHSCPLPVTNNNSDIGLWSDTSLKCQYLNERATAPSTNKYGEDVDEQPTSKGRFSFSIGRMTRSLSSKEGPVTPRSSSHKSGTVRFEYSVSLDDSNINQANMSGRAKSSPLRRLLNPLLKSKEITYAETQSPKGNVKPVSFNPMKKTEGECAHALLHCTVKNEIPLFKLVVDNSCDILAASMKNQPTPVKDNTSLTYVVYSVSEIKKKSGLWMTQGSKDKKSGFGYNIVGEMKVSSSDLSDLVGQNMNGEDAVQQFVLYGGDLGQVDKEYFATDVTPNRELAAIVLKDLYEKTDNGLDSDTNFTVPLANKDSKTAVVILPGDIHGLPSKGHLSSLINRWRGKCDCEGWDQGCKLQILTNGAQGSKISKASMSCSATDCLHLFVQGKQNMPIFSLTSLKDEHYSVEYNTSISSLQAFAICMAFMNNWKLQTVSQLNALSEVKCITEPMVGKISLTSSPVGRA